MYEVRFFTVRRKITTIPNTHTRAKKTSNVVILKTLDLDETNEI